MNVAILVPVLDRPHNIAPLIASIDAATQEPHRTVFIATEGDRREIEALEAAGVEYLTIARPGTYARKINVGTRETSEPLLFSAADDLRFHPGWLDEATKLLRDGIEVVGTNDLGNPRTMSGEHSTHTLYTRRYIDTRGGVIDQPPGVVLNELYPHEFCDDELIQTAKFRGVYAHAFDSHVEHLHYTYGKAKMDRTYRLGRSKTAQSRRVFRARQHLWT